MPPQQESRSCHMITAALIYANGPVHIGHVAGCYLPADIYARYLRLCKKDVCFVSGTDEHGAPITLQAYKQGCSPQEIVDHYHQHIKDTLHTLGISFDIFDRTSHPDHHKVATDFFLTLDKKKCFEKKETAQYYDDKQGIFLADRYIQGECPSCAYADAYGDQCEACGRSLSPQELKQPRSIFGGSSSLRRTTNWYLPLNKWQNELNTYIASHKKNWKRNVYGQCQSWLTEGLRSRAMTRDLDWGIPVPLENAAGKVLYVWFDAPIGYITATKKLHPTSWEKYWKNPDSELVHFIGKDNIVFHCLIFPLMLMLHGTYILPKAVPANEFLNLEGKKLSTSRGWAVWVHDYLKDFPDKQDVLRYTLCAKMPENKDSNFSWKELQAHNNNELLATFGNFVHRILHLAHKHTSGQVPTCTKLRDIDKQAIQAVWVCFRDIGKHVETFHFQEGLAAMMQIARIGNRYITEEEPWKDINHPALCATKIYTALQICAVLGTACTPFLPFTAKKMQNMLGLHNISPSWQGVPAPDEQTLLPAKHKLKKPVPLFTKIEDSAIEQQLHKLHTVMTNTQGVPPKQETDAIDIDAFARVDMRVGTVLQCEAVPKSSKLLRLTLDDGKQKRIILSGIAAHYEPKALIGTQVVFVRNLPPRKMMGEVSEGMVLCASTKDTLRLLRPDELIDAGTKIS